MLVEKEVTWDVASFKMNNGDEVVAKVISQTGKGEFVIEFPLLLAMTQRGPAFVPYMTTIDLDANLHIDSSKYMIAHKTEASVAESYRTMKIEMTTGIKTAPQSIFTG